MPITITLNIPTATAIHQSLYNGFSSFITHGGWIILLAIAILKIAAAITSNR